MINNYSNYISDIILENIINETFLYYSTNFTKIIKRLSREDNPIAKDLVAIISDDIKPDITFVDLSKDGYLSFITKKNAIATLLPTYPEERYSQVYRAINISPSNSLARALEDNPENGLYSTKSRSDIRIGRFINKIFPKKYTDKQIDEFVNRFRASIENLSERIVVMEGADISKYYNESFYYEDSGTIGNSCMRKSPPRTFQIYTDNPSVCRMLVIIEDDNSGVGKIKARALVWRVNKTEEIGFEYFMDRQYTIHNKYVEIMRKYAEEQGWAYKTNNNHSSLRNITYKGNDFRGSMSVQIPPKDGQNKYTYDKYPYMDTFRRYDVSKGILHNDDDQIGGCYILEDTGGGYTEVVEDQYSEYYDRTIPEGQYVYSEPLGDYLWQNRSVYVSYGSNRGYYPDDYEDIVSIGSSYYHIDDCCFSDYLDEYILRDDSISIVGLIENKLSVNTGEFYVPIERTDIYIEYSDVEKTKWFKFIKDNEHSEVTKTMTISRNKIVPIKSYPFRNWNLHEGILKSLLTKDYQNNYIPKAITIETYLVKEDKSKIDYLTLLDAQAIGYSIDKNKKRIVDIISYIQTLMESKMFTEIVNSDHRIRTQYRIHIDSEYEKDIEKELENRKSHIELMKFFANYIKN